MIKNRPLWLALAIMAGYMAARYWVYRAMPVTREVSYADIMGEEDISKIAIQRLTVKATVGNRTILVSPNEGSPELKAMVAHVRAERAGRIDYGLWLRRDLWMTLPRVTALAACLAVMWFFGGFRLWGWHWRITGASGAFVVAESIVFFLLIYSANSGYVFPLHQAVLGSMATLPVALMEESLFRGLLFTSLRREFAPSRAAAISSVLFAVYHLQAQSLLGWPRFFIYGLVNCAAVELGAGLTWLAASHAAIDIWGLFGGMSYDFGASHPGIYLPAAAANLTLAVWAWRRLAVPHSDAP